MTMVRDAVSARERLLEAAAALIIQSGSINISLSEIAVRAGLNAALVKYYFGSKNGMLRALLRRDAQRALEEMKTLLAMQIGAAEKMRLHLRGIMRAYQSSPYLNRLLHAMLTSTDQATVAEIHETFVRPVMDCQHAILDEGRLAGVFRSTDPMLFYLGAVGACDQFMHSERMFRLSTGTAPDPSFSARYMAFVEDMVLASIRQESHA